jgi:alpha-N-arabinofuranosidase
MTLTVVNPHISEATNAEIAVRGASVQAASATVLTHSDIHAHNTFSQREVVIPKAQTVAVQRATAAFTFPAASVTRMTLTLA